MAQPNPGPTTTTNATPGGYVPPKTPPQGVNLFQQRAAELARAGATFNAAPAEQKFSYWEDPQRVARYRDMLRAAPPGFEPPEWLDPSQIEQAYQYIKFRNNDRPVREWAMLPGDDPGRGFLQSLPTPPEQFLPASERNWAQANPPPAQAQPDPFGDWDNLKLWQQVYLGAFAPQPGLANRPEWTRYTAAAGQGALAIPGAAAVGALVGGPVGAVVGGGIAGVGTAYQALTGQRVPILGDLLDVFNLLPVGAKKVIGLGAQAEQEGLEKMLAHLPAAWEAAGLSYETAQMDLLNLVAQAAGDQPAGAGEVWQISRGLSEPVKLEGSGARGGAALIEARGEIERLVAGGMSQAEAALQVYQEYTDRFGDSGTFNDFILQTVIDPTNALPWVGGKVGEGVARAAGNERLAAAMKAGQGSLAADMVPFVGDMVARAFGSHGSSGPVAAFQTYRDWIRSGYFPGEMEPVRAGELSAFEKAVGGLDEQGRIRELAPAEKQAGALGWVRYLNELTPEAKAQSFVTMAQDNLNVILSMAEGDPEQMVRLVHQAAGMTPLQAAEVGRAMLGSPVTATVAQALRDVLRDGWDQDLLLRWTEGEERRGMLANAARALGEKPADILQQYQDNPAALMERIRAKGGPAGNPAALREIFDLFTGEDPHPWNEGQFQAQLALTLFDKMDDWLVKRYDLKPEAGVFRLSKTLKGMQSILLLGFNPAYFVNNQVNNMVTRAASGVFGYMTPRQITGFLDRFGITPERLSDSLGVDGAGRERGAIEAAVRGGDWIAGVHRVVNATNRKLGVFSKFSSMGEALESRNAFTIGMLKFWKGHWREGVGFDRMRPEVEAMLDRSAPGVKEAIYGAVRAGMNMREVEAALLGQSARASVSDAIDQAARAIDPDNPDAARELLESQGIAERLEDLLKDAETPEQADAAFRRVEREIGDMVEEHAARDLAERAEAARVRVQSEGWPAALELFSEMQTRIGVRWLKHFEALENLFARRGEMSAEAWDAAYRAQDASDSMEWKRLNQYERQAYAGIIRALGVDSPASARFVDLLTDSHENWRRFYDGHDDPNGVHHDGRRDLYRKFFATQKRKKGEPWREYSARSDAAWKKLQAKLDRMYQDAVAKENQLQAGMNTIFADLWRGRGGDGTQAKQWRERVLTIRQQMQNEMTAFRRAVEAANLDADARRVLWTEFLKRYNQLVIDLKTAEVEGANNLANTQASRSATQRAADALEAARPRPQEAAPGEPDTMTEAERQARQANQRRDANMALALRYGIVDKAGRPVAPYLLNIINKRQPEGAKYNDIADVPEGTATAALEAHRDAHKARYAEREAILRNKVDRFLGEADAEKRDAQMRGAGLMTRRHLKEQLLAVGRPEVEVDAALILMDHHADVMARRAGKTPSDATRAEWYATRIDRVLSEPGGDGLSQLHDELYQAAPLRWFEKLPETVDPTKVTMAEWLKSRPLPAPDSIPQKGQFDAIVTDDGSIYIGDGSPSTHILLMEKKGIPPERVKEGGWVIDGVYQEGSADARSFAEQARAARRAQWKRVNRHTNTLPQGENGAVRFLDDGRAVIRAFSSANATTIIHEVGHIFRRDLPDRDLETIAQVGGLNDAAEYRTLEAQFRGGEISEADRARYTRAEETFARLWERYLGEGDAPTPALKGIFQQFTAWMKDIYKRLKEIMFNDRPTLTDWQDQPEFSRENINYQGGLLYKPDGVTPIRDIFDRLLVDERQAEEATLMEPDTGPGPMRSEAEQAFVTLPVKKLPAHVQAGVKRIAERIRAELAGSGVLTLKQTTVESGAEVDQYSRVWEAPQWYKDMYRREEEAFGSARAGTLKGRIMAQLDSIISGGDTGRAEIGAVVKQMIVDAALGDDPYFPVMEPGLLRYLGENDLLFRDHGNTILNADDAQLREWFGDEAPQVVDDLLMWMSENQPQDTPDIRVEEAAAQEVATGQEVATPQEPPVESPVAEPAPEVAPIPAEPQPQGNVAAEPWQMTQAEYIRANVKPRTAYSMGYDEQTARWDHQSYVEAALSDGEVVPRSVLADYPDLTNGEQAQTGDGWLMQRTSAGTTPEPEPFAQTLDEVTAEKVRPLLAEVHRAYRARAGEQAFQLADLSGEASDAVRAYLRDVSGQMASTKFAAMRYGEQMRDSALLNYNRRYGLDNVMELLFPYQFWYTRSMMEWSKRMIDRPAWFGMYARLQEMQEKLKANMPERLRGKVRIPAPWLPEWAGGGLWVDPMSKLLPFSSFGEPMERYTQGLKQTELHAQEVLDGWVDAGTITASDARKAKADRSGAVWEKALAQAGADEGQGAAPLNIAGMMMTPSLWWTTAQNLAQGTPEKISPLPITRTAGAIETATQGTPLAGFGKVMGLFAQPERKIRGAAGLSEFGEWGDYYIDRQLANMAAEGTISATEAKQAMVERQGELFEQARARVRYEQMLQVPGMALMQQAAEGDVMGTLQALPTVIFGGSLFPTGELELRGLKNDFTQAFQARDQGDPEAVNRFFDENPEYEARLALNQPAGERLRQFLVSEIWDRYSAVDKANRSKASKALGPLFEDAFLNSETRSYESIPVETLARWAQMLEGVVPKTPETQAVVDDPEPPVDWYSGEQAAAIQAYQQERGEKFPNYYAVQSAYFAIPETEKAARRRFLTRFPQLKQYWDWKRAQEQANPLLSEYFEDGRRAAQGQSAPAQAGPALTERDLAQVDGALMRQVLTWRLAGQPLTRGALAELSRLAGKRYTAEEYAALIAASMAPAQ